MYRSSGPNTGGNPGRADTKRRVNFSPVRRTALKTRHEAVVRTTHSRQRRPGPATTNLATTRGTRTSTSSQCRVDDFESMSLQVTQWRRSILLTTCDVARDDCRSLRRVGRRSLCPGKMNDVIEIKFVANICSEKKKSKVLISIFDL